MQTNNLHSPVPGDEGTPVTVTLSSPKSAPLAPKVGEDHVNGIALDVLHPKEDSFAEVNAAPLKNKVSPSSAKQGGVLNSIITFFNRRFSSVTLSEQQQAQNIQVLTGKLERAIEDISDFGKKARQSEKQFSHTYPSDDSIQTHEEHLKNSKNLLQLAKKHLAELKKHEATAKNLAAAHTAFDALPLEIQQLEKNLLYLEGRVDISEKLLDLEKALQTYRTGGEEKTETWEQFTDIRDARRELSQTLQRVVVEHPDLKEKAEVQSYAQSKMTAKDAHALIQDVYPNLTSQVERLFDHLLVVQEKRLENLDKQAEELKPLFAEYSQLAKHTANLETTIYDRSLPSKIYRYFHSFFHDKESMRSDLVSSQEALRAKYEEIQEKGHFNPEEIKWLENIAHSNPNYEPLARDLYDIRYGLNFLDVRTDVSEQMDSMIDLMHHYQPLKMGKGKDSSTLAQANREIKEDIREGIKGLAHSLYNFKLNKKQLPSDFNTMEPLKQLKTLASLSFNSLQTKTERLIRLIDKKGLHEETNQAILARLEELAITPVGSESFLEETLSETELPPAPLSQKELSETVKAESTIELPPAPPSQKDLPKTVKAASTIELPPAPPSQKDLPKTVKAASTIELPPAPPSQKDLPETVKAESTIELPPAPPSQTIVGQGSTTVTPSPSSTQVSPPPPPPPSPPKAPPPPGPKNSPRTPPGSTSSSPPKNYAKLDPASSSPRENLLQNIISAAETRAKLAEEKAKSPPPQVSSKAIKEAAGPNPTKDEDTSLAGRLAKAMAARRAVIREDNEEEGLPDNTNDWT